MLIVLYQCLFTIQTVLQLKLNFYASAQCFHCDATTAATFGHPFELRTTERTHTLVSLCLAASVIVMHIQILVGNCFKFRDTVLQLSCDLTLQREAFISLVAHQYRT